MKEIERFLNHLYYAAYYMTAWIAFVPTRKRVEYERSIELEAHVELEAHGDGSGEHFYK